MKHPVYAPTVLGGLGVLKKQQETQEREFEPITNDWFWNRLEDLEEPQPLSSVSPCAMLLISTALPLSLSSPFTQSEVVMSSGKYPNTKKRENEICPSRSGRNRGLSANDAARLDWIIDAEPTHRHPYEGSELDEIDIRSVPAPMFPENPYTFS